MTLTKAPSSAAPTSIPSLLPSAGPSDNPSQSPTHNPSQSPSQYPTVNPSRAPSPSPSMKPSVGAEPERSTVRRALTLDGSFAELSAYLSEHDIDAAVFGRDAIAFAIGLAVTDSDEEGENDSDVEVTVLGVFAGSVVIDYVLAAPDAAVLETATQNIDRRIAGGEVFVFGELSFAVTGNALVDSDIESESELTEPTMARTREPSTSMPSSTTTESVVTVAIGDVDLDLEGYDASVKQSGNESSSDGLMTGLAVIIAVGLWLNVCFAAVWCCARWRRSRQPKVSREFTVERTKEVQFKDRCRSGSSRMSPSPVPAQFDVERDALSKAASVGPAYEEEALLSDVDEEEDVDEDEQSDVADETSLEEVSVARNCESVQLL